MLDNKLAENAYKNGYDKGYQDGLTNNITYEQATEDLVKKMESGEIPLKDGYCWIRVTDECVFTKTQLQFFKKATPKQLYACLAKISQEYHTQVMTALEKERKESDSEQVDWDRIMEIILGVDGVGKVIGGRIDKEVRSRFE